MKTIKELEAEYEVCEDCYRNYEIKIEIKKLKEVLKLIKELGFNCLHLEELQARIEG